MLNKIFWGAIIFLITPNIVKADCAWVLWENINLSPNVDWHIVAVFPKHEQCIKKQIDDNNKIKEVWKAAKITILSPQTFWIEAGVATYFYTSRCLPDTIDPRK